MMWIQSFYAYFFMTLIQNELTTLAKETDVLISAMPALQR